MSKCEYYQELISRMMDEELSSSESAALAEHLETCPDCAFMHAAFSGLSEAIAEDMAEVPESLRYNIMAEIKREEIKKKNRKSKLIKRTLTAAACFALVVAVGAGVMPKLKMGSSAVSFDAAAPAAEAPMEAAAPEVFRFRSEESVVEEEAAAEVTAEEAVENAQAEVQFEADASVAEAQYSSFHTSDTAAAYTADDSLEIRLEDMEVEALLAVLAGEESDLIDLGENEPVYMINSESYSISLYLIEGSLYYTDNVTGLFYRSGCGLEEIENFF